MQRLRQQHQDQERRKHHGPKLCSQYRSTTFQTLYHVLPWEIGIRPPGSATFKGDDCENRKLARAAHYRYPIDQDKSDWTCQTGQHATHSHSGVVPTVAAPIPYLICLSHENNTCISHILATFKVWPPGLSKGQQSLFLKFIHTSQFEHAAKSIEGMTFALIVGNNDCCPLWTWWHLWPSSGDRPLKGPARAGFQQIVKQAGRLVSRQSIITRYK